MSDAAWWVYVLSVTVGVGVGWWIGSSKGYPLLGAALGILSLFGWIIMWMIPARPTHPRADDHA